MKRRVYLAGPEVFLRNAREIVARKRAICERHGLIGVFPATKR
jgi:nucleoside 2-deoxyribosyltransferase